MDRLRRALWSSDLIRVASQTEPSSFHKLVRVPGQAFLKTTPNPRSKDYEKHRYWKHAAQEVFEAYNRVCAYTCRFISESRGSIDHFHGKTLYPALAYEWSNYRLCLGRVNGHKDDFEGIVDPFVVQTGWFVLDFPSCLIRPGPDLTSVLHSQIVTTIEVLKLNEDDSFVQDRSDNMFLFAQGQVAFEFLQKYRPFLAVEVVRQGIDQNSAAALFKPLP